MVCADGGLLWCVGSVGYETIANSSSGGAVVLPMVCADGGLLWRAWSVDYEMLVITA